MQSPFHAYYTARTLENYQGKNSIIPALASSNIEIYPYQVAAANFVLRSAYLHGCILGDECSLGKTYEALLISTQLWYYGKKRQLLIVPVNMIAQWKQKIENSFSIPYFILDTKDIFDNLVSDNPFAQDAVVITSYDFALEKSDYIKKINWDIAIFDEANCLNKAYTGENRTANVLKEATKNSYKLLLTPTPIEMSIMDIYGLIYFIDENILPYEANEFYRYYFRRPDRYHELSNWISKYCFRTLKSQVSGYANFTNRIPLTLGCGFTKEEKELYDGIMSYIKSPESISYPNKSDRDIYNMTLQWGHILSSSTQAIAVTLKNALNRLINNKPDTKDLAANKIYNSEFRLLNELYNMAQNIKISTKMEILVKIIKKCFARFRKLKANQKAIIFADNLNTMSQMCDLLAEKGFKVLIYNKSNVRDYSIMERFRNEKEIQILISNDEMAKGLDIEFCPAVINYDLLTNSPEIEQRICRCHRQGQKSDVIVINLFEKENFADIRYLELINKRTLQFDSIFGMSDTILGNFDMDIDDVLSKLRPINDIETYFHENLQENKNENEEITKQAENMLFTTFTKDISDQVTLVPQYIENEIEKLNEDLWNVAKCFFEQYNEDEKVFEIDDELKTINLIDKDNSPLLFTYMIDRFPQKPKFQKYYSISKYGIGSKFKPIQGRITITGFLANGIFKNLKCEEYGSLVVDSDIEKSTIGLYCISIVPKDSIIPIDINYYVFTGQTESGKILSNEECKKIMSLPVLSYKEEFKIDENQKRMAESNGLKYRPTRHSFEDRSMFSKPKPHQIDNYVPVNEYIKKYIEDYESANSEEIEQIKLQITKKKEHLELELNDIKAHVDELKYEVEHANERVKKMRAERQLKLAQKELMEKEENLFLHAAKLDFELEKQIQEITNNSQITAKVKRHYLIEVYGNQEVTHERQN